LRVTDVRLISQGSSSLSLGFVVPEADLRAAVEALDREFFAAPDLEVFAAPEFAPSRATQPANRGSYYRRAGQPQVAPAH